MDRVRISPDAADYFIDSVRVQLNQQECDLEAMSLDLLEQARAIEGVLQWQQVRTVQVVTLIGKKKKQSHSTSRAKVTLTERQYKPQRCMDVLLNHQSILVRM
jgi:hypothetical protein